MRVVFVGGDQAELLFRAFQQRAGAETQVDFVDLTRHVDRDGESLVAAADRIAIEARGTPLPFDLDDIGAAGERIWFPQLSLDFLWPFGGQPHLFNTRGAFQVDGPFPVELGDAYLNRRLQGRQLIETLGDEYLRLDIARSVDLDAFRELTFQRLRELDQACNTDFASRIEREFRDHQLFANPLRPRAELMRAQAAIVFGRLGHASDGVDFSDEAHEAPLHPSVIAHFHLKWAENRNWRLNAGDRVDFAEYVLRYVAYAEGPELESGLRLAAAGRFDEALAPLQIGTSRPAGRRSISARNAFRTIALMREAQSAGASTEVAAAAALFALGRPGEAEAELLALLERDSEDISALHALAEIRERRGDRVGQIAALRSALSARPNDPALMSRLTLALAAAGDVRGAIASAEAEVAFNPANPHSLAFLSSLLSQADEPARAETALRRAIEIASASEDFGRLREDLQLRLMELTAASTVG